MGVGGSILPLYPPFKGTYNRNVVHCAHTLYRVDTGHKLNLISKKLQTLSVATCTTQLEGISTHFLFHPVLTIAVAAKYLQWPAWQCTVLYVCVVLGERTGGRGRLTLGLAKAEELRHTHTHLLLLNTYTQHPIRIGQTQRILITYTCAANCCQLPKTNRNV